jgi:hypothetical protein
MLQTQPFEVSDFSGGITDHYVDGPPNCAEELDNLLLTTNAKPKTRPGSVLFLEEVIPLGNQRIGALINHNLDQHLLVSSARDLIYEDAGAWATLVGPGSNKVFTAGSATTNIAHAFWNGHTFLTNDEHCPPMKVYEDSAGDLQVRNAGLPRMSSSPSCSGTAGVNNYLYAFCYIYEYTVGSLTFIDFGATTLVEVPSVNEPSASAVGMTAIPAIVSGLENYDTANIKIGIFRTITNGTTFYKVGEVTNGTTVFSDTMSDATLQNQELLYINGGVLDNDPAPLAKYIHVAGDIAWYANIKEGTEYLTYRVRQSHPGDPDSCPETFYVDMPEEIKGISSINGVPIVLCKKGIYRIDGAYDELGRGAPIAQKIADSVGCVSHNSIVQTQDALFFAGNDGFYTTDGFKVVKISSGLDATYKNLVSSAAKQARITGCLESENNRVWWGVTDGSAATDNDVCFVLDLRWGVRPQSTFTTASGTSFAPTALTFFNGQLIRGDSRGFVFKHDEEYKTDPQIDTTEAPGDWLTETIIHLYVSVATNFGTNFVRKWVTRISLVAKNETNVSLQINSNNDDNRKTKALVPIRFRGNVVWGDELVTWGDITLVWNYDGLIEEWRRFPAGVLRCSYKQIEITNAYVIVANSDTQGTATLNNTAKTVYLDGAPTTTWNTDLIDYYISFESDGYTKQFLITDRTDDTLTVSDASNQMPTGTQQWVISGYPRGEVMHLLGYTLHYAPLGKTQEAFSSSKTGANA